MTKHVDYPHEPGTLYDCEACETECYCEVTDGVNTFECIKCALDHDLTKVVYSEGGRTVTAYVPPF